MVYPPASSYVWCKYRLVLHELTCLSCNNSKAYKCHTSIPFCKQQSRHNCGVYNNTAALSVYTWLLWAHIHAYIHSQRGFLWSRGKIKSCCFSLWRNNKGCMCNLYPDTHAVHRKYSTVIYARVQLRRGKMDAGGKPVSSTYPRPPTPRMNSHT